MPRKEDVAVEVVDEDVNKGEVEDVNKVYANALLMSESHITSINLGSSVSIAMSMYTLLTIVTSQTVERGRTV